MKLIIPCAGKGTRLKPITLETPKTLIKINGKTVLESLIERFKSFNFEEIILIVNYMKEKIKSSMGESILGIPIRYVEQKELKGIAHAILQAEEFIENDFMVVLGDEVYIGTNHEDMIAFHKENNSDAVCGIMHEENTDIIKKNYIVEMEGKNVLKIVEKPEKINEKIMGVGTWIFNKSIFDFIKSTPPSKLRNEIEIADVLQRMIDGKKKVQAFVLNGKYVNLNY
ncbi:MAG: nucleotidyltransferase family protein, partial [Candidatus Nanoarchaeia archaeon]|nr:nucleotidyltransferase family protein [Candidatus Nanoarchaeia archaeon]MDD5054510.1 nucleotidyltransferase family protein [Candidatus Nanoarchaeia archaeon]